MSLVEQEELLTLPEHLPSSPVHLLAKTEQLYIWSRTQILNSESQYVIHRLSNVCKTLETHERRIRGVIVSMLPTSEVNRVFEPQSGQTKDISYFSAKHAPLRNKKKGWLASIIKIQLSVLVYYISPHRNITCSCHDMTKMLHNNHSLGCQMEQLIHYTELTIS